MPRARVEAARRGRTPHASFEAPTGTEAWGRSIRGIESLARAIFGIEARPFGPHVRVPTLVIHARGDAVVPFDASRRLAASIPGARLLPLESDNHLLLETEPAWARFVGEVERFLAPAGRVGSDETSMPGHRPAR